MRILPLVLVLCMGCLFPAQAQLVISVDTSLSRNTGKSLPAAAAMSLVIPGMGQRYLGEASRVRAFLWTDAAAWSAVAITWFAGDTYLRSAQGYASKYAGIVHPPKDPTFLDLMGRYRSRAGVAGQNSNPDPSEDYNMTLIRAGKAVDYEYPFDAAHTWDWGSSENPDATAHMSQYNQIMHNYRFTKISFQVALGVIVLNRLVSVLDVVRIHRATSGAPLSFDLLPLWSPQVAGADLHVNF